LELGLQVLLKTILPTGKIAMESHDISCMTVYHHHNHVLDTLLHS
jgi:hypothetical protein